MVSNRIHIAAVSRGRSLGRAHRLYATRVNENTGDPTTRRHSAEMRVVRVLPGSIAAAQRSLSTAKWPIIIVVVTLLILLGIGTTGYNIKLPPAMYNKKPFRTHRCSYLHNNIRHRKQFTVPCRKNKKLKCPLFRGRNL